MTDTPKLPQFVRLIGGPRDGTEFQTFGGEDEIDLAIGLAGFQVEPCPTTGRHMITTTAQRHMYSCARAYLEKVHGQRAVVLEFKHSGVEES